MSFKKFGVFRHRKFLKVLRHFGECHFEERHFSKCIFQRIVNPKKVYFLFINFELFINLYINKYINFFKYENR